MIQVENLTKQFQQFVAVDHLGFEVSPGEVLGFLGPNGAGKSTTMKMLTGFLAPTAGRVVIHGFDMQKQALAAKQKIGYLPEGAPCYGDMSTRDFLAFIADIRGMKGSHRKQRLAEVVGQIGLEAVSGKKIDTLSKGFKRRVGLAQAILHDPDILILDEPTDGLDPNQKHHVRELIRNLSREKIVIVSTHILEEVSAVCSRAMIIDHGKLVVDTTPRELEKMSRYHEAVQARLDPASHQAAEQLFSTCSEVDCFEFDRVTGSYTVFPKAQQDISGMLRERLASQNIPVLEFYSEKGRLDDVFRSLTTGRQS